MARSRLQDAIDTLVSNKRIYPIERDGLEHLLAEHDKQRARELLDSRAFLQESPDDRRRSRTK